MNLVESLGYLAKECPSIFGPIKQEFENLKSENEGQKRVIESLGKQLTAEKLERIKNIGALNQIGKELAETKIKNMKGGN